MLNNLSFKNKLAISASLSLILGIAVLEVVNFQNAIHNLNQTTTEQIRNSIGAYNRYVADWFASKGRALEALPATTDSMTAQSHLEQVRDSGDFDNVFLAFSDGSQVNANGVQLPVGNNDPREWGWYINAELAPTSVFIDEPTVAAATGANVVSMGKWVTIAGGNAVIGADVEIQDIVQGLQGIDLPIEGEAFISNNKGNVFVHNDTSLLNQSVQKLGLNDQTISQISQTSGHRLLENEMGQQLVVVQTIPNTELFTVVILDHQTLLAPLKASISKQILAILLVLAGCIAVFNVVCARLLKPLKNVEIALKEIASGEGDLTQRLKVESNDEIGQVAKRFNHFMDTLQVIIQHVRNEADILSHNSIDSSSRASDAANVLSAQQQEVAMIATAVTQMSSATKEIALHADSTAEAALSSTENTQSGQQLVVQTKESIHNLAQELEEANRVISDLDVYANDISNVLLTIREIAEQTNLLALNAAIEAARAGSQGRGFSVVADEVRVLSQRTHSSTEEIKATIETLQKTTKKAVSLMGSSSQLADNSVKHAEDASFAISDIKGSVELISDMATQIATAAQEQSQVTQDINQNVHTLKMGTDNLANVATNALNESKELTQQSKALSQKVGVFKLG
ncbi:methyl-accepting chemotaxis protein [Vibrio astriarenae]|jgi:methyl-accepting chemotaxis protein